MNRGRILVTGGAGYLGSVLVSALVRRGYQVRIFDKLIFGDTGLAAARDQIELVPGDILHPPANLMDGILAVIHLAGLSSQSTASYQSPRYTDRVNHLGTEILALLAKSRGVPRFIFASSCSIYCAKKYTPNTTPPLSKEDDQVDILGPYALSKRAAEEALLQLTDRGFKPVILRKGTLYGLSPKMRYDLVLNSFAKDAFSRRKITVNADGHMHRPMLDIQDAVAAYIAALELPLELVGADTFNVVTANHMIIDLAREFQEILNARKQIAIELDIRPFEVVLDYQADDSKFREVFNLDPVRPLDKAILEIWDALESGDDYTNPRCYNDLWHKEALKQGLLD